jgi:nucleoredoxin
VVRRLSLDLAFTPVLRQLYMDQWKQKGIEVVFVSSDNDTNSFREYYNDMPWLAIPYEDDRKRSELSQKFGISGIPALIVLSGKDGKVISTDGRADVMRDKAGIADRWLKQAQ